MMHHTVDSSESSDNDLFSPVLGRATSQFDLLTPTPDSAKGPISPPDTLPRLQNTSWIGARVSPVPNDNDDEDDDEDAILVAPYHRAMQQASFVGMAGNASESTTLLGRKVENAAQHSNSAFQKPGYPTPLEETVVHKNNQGNSTPYLYNQQQYDHNGKPQHYENDVGFISKWCPRIRQFSSFHWFIPATSALFLSLVGLHDLFLKYLSWRRGVDVTYALMWSIPWLGPSFRSMLRFGAYCPSKIIVGLYSENNQQLQVGDWWRILTGGIWAISSVSEWAVLYVCWCWAIPACHNHRRKPATVTPVSAAQDPYWNNPYDWNRLSQPTIHAATLMTPWQMSWPVIYITSTLTGQLWMMAFEYWGDSNEAGEHDVTLSGCTSWGTAGVLCAKGMQHPERRLELFCLSIVLVLLNLFQPTASIYGAVGASFFGWAFAGIWSTAAESCKKKNMGSTALWQNQFLTDSPMARNVRGWTAWNGLAVVVALSFWVVPIVYLICYS